MKNLEGIQVGDRVWLRSADIFGQVKSIGGGKIRVQFENTEGISLFCLDGRWSSRSRLPDLFFDKIPEPEYPKRPIMLEGAPLKVGDVVYRKSGGEDCVREVKKIDADGIWFCCGAFAYYENITCYTRTKPKRKVKKILECWANVYDGHTYSDSLFHSKALADFHAGKGAVQVKLTGEYEVDE
jgi:hypothetical protein